MLDDLDRKIISLIINDARIPFLEVARACSVSGAAIHQRIQKLTAMGVIRGTQYNIDPEKLGFETCAYLGLTLLHPDKLDKTIEKLKSIPEVVECHQTSGVYDLFVKVYVTNNHALLTLIREKLQPLGLNCRETIMSFGEVLQRPVNCFDD